MLTCQEVAHLASDHLDHALPLRRRLLVEAHLAICPNCQRYLAQLRAALGLARAAGRATPQPSAEDEAKLLELFDRTIGRRGPPE